MEKFRTRFATAGQPRMLLLPLSMGVSSLALLHCLDEQLKRQIENTGRTGFGLQVLHVDMTAIVPEGPPAKDLDAIKARYPTHTYTTIPLSSVMEVENIQDLRKHRHRNHKPAISTNTSPSHSHRYRTRRCPFNPPPQTHRRLCKSRCL
jgi:hypothetical protein